MEEFTRWLGGTELSLLIQSTLWVIPAVQSVHIIAIAILFGSSLMLNLRILGVVSRDQTLAQVNRRFGPWFWFALVVLAATGVILTIGEPRRELMSFSFWAKMAFLAIGIAVTIAQQLYLKSNSERWERELVSAPSARVMAVGVMVIWLVVILMGRLIAFDPQFWGSLSPLA